MGAVHWQWPLARSEAGAYRLRDRYGWHRAAWSVSATTIEEARPSTRAGATTKDGNGWGVGPYDDVIADAAGDPSFLPSPLDPGDHLYVAFTTVEPPTPTDGCVPLVAPTTTPATGAVAGVPGHWTPSGSTPPATLAALQGGSVIASPQTAWTTGEYVQTGTGGAAGQAHWDGDSWEASTAP